eukprot:TRINITY_DN2963_c0_g1_i11.p2 TRINITY_DN2963_c0_g1~~TRINITY_DN2963_c0_g1_i11.p2  ORF type:complete len:132 (-),score=28.90 TRINITY_DN2963_c0_g1_i11:308-703(-)
MNDDDFDFVDEREAQRLIAERELARLREQFTNMGLKEGILEETQAYDQKYVDQGFANGFDHGFVKGYYQGRIEGLKFLVQRVESVLNVADLKEALEALGQQFSKLDETTLKQELYDIELKLNSILAFPMGH